MKTEKAMAELSQREVNLLKKLAQMETKRDRWQIARDLILYIPVVYVIYQLHHVASELQMTTIQVLSPAWGNKR